MLTSLQIKNFKAWKDTGKIRMAPLTVFFGSNSSGKSSINQFLLMLKQTAQSSDRNRVLHPGDNLTAVDLGTYYDLIHAHSEDQKISFDLFWNLLKETQIEDVQSKNQFNAESMGFAATVGPADTKAKDVVVHGMRYVFGDIKAAGFEIGMKRKGNGKSGYELEGINYSPIRNKGRSSLLPSPNRFYGFPEEVVAYYQNTGFVQDLTLELEKQLGRIYYLGPLHAFPERSYTWWGEAPEDIGRDGNLWVNALLASRERRIHPGYKKKGIRFEEMVARWLKRMGLTTDFIVREKSLREYEIIVKIADMTANMADVGFGVSQVLPVIVQCFYASPNSTIILEQPEGQLHPSAQAILADLRSEICRRIGISWENPWKMPTHSQRRGLQMVGMERRVGGVWHLC